jgi:hypothetical protein
MTKNKGGRPVGLHHQYVQDKSQLDTAGRVSCRCVFCPFIYKSMRPEQVWNHVLEQCKEITEESREGARDQYAASKGEELKGPAAKRSRSTQPGIPVIITSPTSSAVSSIRRYTPSSGNVTTQAQKDLDIKLLRALVHAGIPLNAIENPYLLDLFKTLREKWKVPGICTAWRSGFWICATVEARQTFVSVFECKVSFGSS